MTRSSPQIRDVGIHAIQLYFPKNVVDQDELEQHDNVNAGKYTIGLGQKEMSFCGDDEDVVSLALTVTKQLIDTYSINTNSIGFLAVGTETLIDKSKSVKSELMPLFGDNHDIEGVDVKNACFGGTQAVFHAIDWIYANYETDGRMAMAVLCDIAVYEPGPARCTGGAGAIAVLIGPDAPIAFEKGLRATYMAGTWDFYKPIGGCVVSEYPTVDGRVSVSSYMTALEGCYETYKKKAKRLRGEQDVSLSSFSAAMFHSPFTRLVQKAVARLSFVDMKDGSSQNADAEKILDTLSSSGDCSIGDRIAMDLLLSASSSQWKQLTDGSLDMNRRTGNMYTPSLFLQLVCWLAKCQDISSDRRILMFAYGSGAASAMFSLSVTNDELGLSSMRKVCRSALERLDKRTKHSPQRYTQVMRMREKFLATTAPSVPVALDGHNQDLSLFPGTFYLKSIDKQYRRTYCRTDDIITNGGSVNGTNGTHNECNGH